MHRTVRGTKMVFDDEGRGAPLLFVHGYPLSRHAWRPQLEEFRKSHRVLVPDLCGFGESASRSGVVSMEEYAKDLAALLDELGESSATVLGHSMGGYIALAFARLFPERVSRLALVATRAVADSPDAAAARRATAQKVLEQGVASVIEAMTPKMLSARNRSPEMLARVRALMEKATPQGVAGALLGMAQRLDSSPFLPQISALTLVITGAEDELISPQESVAMAQAIPGARLEILPGAGHLPSVEVPDRFNEALRAFLISR